jgi:hypothetical protein
MGGPHRHELKRRNHFSPGMKTSEIAFPPDGRLGPPHPSMGERLGGKSSEGAYETKQNVLLFSDLPKSNFDPICTLPEPLQMAWLVV